MKKMKTGKKVIVFVLAFCMLFALAACGEVQTTPATAEPEATETAQTQAPAESATYEGEGTGKGGPIDVAVTLDNGKLTAIEVVSHNESDIICEAMDVLTEEMIAGNTVAVDSISGATLTSAGFKMAVKNALENGGVDSAALESIAVEAAQPQTVEETYDVVVIGAGGAGLTAAITAAEEGVTVAVVEKMAMTCGNTLLSGAELAAPNNWLQKEQGIEDSIELMEEDVLAGGDYKADPALVATLCENAVEGAEWLRDDVGVIWEEELMHFGGHSVTRSLIPQGASGEELIVKLRAKAEDIGVTIYYNARANTLLTDDSGAVTGVYAEDTNGNGSEYTLMANGGVVIASGGFGSNVEMREQYNPELGAKYKSTDSVAATGDGITMAQEVGAQLTGMEYIQTYPYCDVISGGLLYVDDARLYGYSIMVNKEGTRFINELGRRDEMSHAILEQTGNVCYELMDGWAFENAQIQENHGGEVAYLYAQNKMVKADTLEEAAEFFGIDAETLVKTVEQYNSYVDNGTDEDYQRPSMNCKIEQGPFYLVEAAPAVHHTMGGIKINTNAEVLDGNDNVITGLYAAGEVTGGIHGTNRLGSCAIADITVYGRIAGANAAASK